MWSSALPCRDIPARYLLRLGMGERDLDVDDDFSRAGRVNNMLARRLTLLAEVGTTRCFACSDVVCS